jgi:hypothetical protein
MVCCALAAFVLSQIILAIDWARERAGQRMEDGVALAGANPTVAWRLGDEVGPSAARWARTPSSRAAWRPRPVALALSVAVLAVGLGFAVSLESSSEVHVYHPSFWCSSAVPPNGDGTPVRR